MRKRWFLTLVLFFGLGRELNLLAQKDKGLITTEQIIQSRYHKFSDTTQMPVLPFSLRSIYEQSKSKAVLKEFLYPLIDYFVS